MKYKDITLEEIEKAVAMLNGSFIKNTKWVGEDGCKYSSWDISSGDMHICTGDGGAEIFMKAFRNSAKKNIK